MLLLDDFPLDHEAYMHLIIVKNSEIYMAIGFYWIDGLVVEGERWGEFPATVLFLCAESCNVYIVDFLYLI